MPYNQIAHLSNRCLIRLCGPDWATFLKGLCTAHIDDMVAQVARGEMSILHYGAFLRPQGKVIGDALLHAHGPEEIWLDVAAPVRAELLSKLNMYRLRAKVTIEPFEIPVFVAFGAPKAGFMPDPRAPICGGSWGIAYGEHTATAGLEAWNIYRMGHGISDAGNDFPSDALYAIDANLDLLSAVDFHKGCYVGQELTSRMKRRGQIKNRLLPFTYENHPPAADAEVVNGDLRAGNVIVSEGGTGLALMRLDRLDGEFTDGFDTLKIDIPTWIGAAITT